MERISLFDVQTYIYNYVAAKARLSRALSEPLKTGFLPTRLISQTNLAYCIILVVNDQSSNINTIKTALYSHGNKLSF